MTRREKQNLMWGLLFVSPWLVGLGVFTLYPVLASLYYSFCEYNVLTEPVFIGLGNYQDLLTDEIFWKALANTFYYASFSLPLGTVLALILAMLLNTGVRGMTTYRVVFFVPSLVPMIAMAILWMWIFNPEFGILNYILQFFGFHGPNWLGSAAWTKPAFVFMSFWTVGNAIVIYLAALQEVPLSLYESADIDGASWHHKIRHITLPMISPVIFFNFVMGLIGSLQVFAIPYVMTAGTGQPVRSALFYAMYLYDTAFRYLKMGYACAMAVILFLIILALTAWVMRVSRKHVHYMGG